MYPWMLVADLFEDKGLNASRYTHYASRVSD